MKILITGTAGFIGFHTASYLLNKGYNIVGLDNINDYYDIRLKYGRLKQTGINGETCEYGRIINSYNNHFYRFIKSDLEDQETLDRLFKEEKFTHIVHLAAQAGVRYSLSNPRAYIRSNINGFLNLLESCRHYPVEHLVFASSSSVYGLNEQMPFSVKNNADHPISLYAASKKSNELMAHAYSYLFDIPVTGLRFFTVYGPWGRPDMALFIFTSSILAGKPIDVFNNGEMERDYTYIDDIVDGIGRIIESPPKGTPGWDGKNPDPSSSRAPYRIYNIGNNKPVNLMNFIKAIQEATGRKAHINLLPLQPGDVTKTWADTEDLFREFQYKPKTTVKTGVKKFVEWYTDYYKINQPEINL
jgi:UDP-glucuronate 4-epimerase